jgi:hypothetical protein
MHFAQLRGSVQFVLTARENSSALSWLGRIGPPIRNQAVVVPRGWFCEEADLHPTAESSESYSADSRVQLNSHMFEDVGVRRCSNVHRYGSESWTVRGVDTLSFRVGLVRQPGLPHCQPQSQSLSGSDSCQSSSDRELLS